MKSDVFSVFKDVLCDCVCGIRALGDPVDEFRETDCSVKGVVALHEKQRLVDGIVPDGATGMAHLFDVRVKVERTDLLFEIDPLPAQRNNEAFQSKAKHRAGALRGPPYDFLSLGEGMKRVGRKVWRRLDRRKFRPDVLSIHPEIELSAMDALQDDDLVLVVLTGKDLLLAHPVVLSAVRTNEIFLV